MNGATTHFVYSDVDGQLLGEYTASGNPIREYIHLEGERVAMYDYTTVEPKDSTNQKAIVYLHNNQVGQVQYAFNSDGQMIYERVQIPFGETMGEINAYNLQMPVRFPGQYYDAETGFNQNWFRTYDPARGAYNEPDPIGMTRDYKTNPELSMRMMIFHNRHEFSVSSLLNQIYAYAGLNPIMLTDFYGLDPLQEACEDPLNELIEKCRKKMCGGQMSSMCAMPCEEMGIDKLKEQFCEPPKKPETPKPPEENCAKYRWSVVRGWYVDRSECKCD